MGETRNDKDMEYILVSRLLIIIYNSKSSKAYELNGLSFCEAE
jgi:hypothetical protein